MNKSIQSEWRISVIALIALQGTFISIFVVQGELNLTFAIGYLSVFALVVMCNAIYVFFKRRNKNGLKYKNQNRD